MKTKQQVKIDRKTKKAYKKIAFDGQWHNTLMTVKNGKCKALYVDGGKVR